jgi:hypothetical protein
MYVRFRQRNSRLLLSLVQTRRVDGKATKEHVATLPSVRVDPTVDERIRFWQRIHERLANLSNRVGAEDQRKALEPIHRRVPMVTLDEQRDLQLRNAEADERFWSSIRDMNKAAAADFKGLVATTQRAAASMESAAKDADAKIAAAKERKERIGRGESVEGGLGKPLDFAAAVRFLGDQGFTARDIRDMVDVANVPEDVFAEFIREKQEAICHQKRAKVMPEIRRWLRKRIDRSSR